MSMLAHFEELPGRSERRRSVRRSLKLGLAGGNEDVAIRDLSLTGVLLETSVPMLVGAAFEFELPQAGKVNATVVWTSGEFYGCQFDLPIPPSVLSAALLRGEPERKGDGKGPDPLAELRELSCEVESLALKMENALKRLTRK